MAKWMSLENMKQVLRKTDARYVRHDQIRTVSGIFKASEWKQSNGKWTQTAPCEGMRASLDYCPPYTDVTTDNEQVSAAYILAGTLESLDGQIRATVIARPTADVRIFVKRR